MKLNHLALLGILVLLSLTSVSAVEFTQHREHLTPEEIDLVKEAQILDKRIEVFVKAASRRVLALNGVSDAKVAKQLKKDAEKWGELPTGSRAELLGDITRILDEAITNIDNVSERDERNPLIPKALRYLATETTKIVDQVKGFREQAQSDAEIASFEGLIENAETILEAASKLPPAEEKKGKR